MENKIKTQRLLPEILSENSTYSNTHILKRRLLKAEMLIYNCAICGLDKWLDNPISLHLDHINGINNDHRLENLRLLCPNCHSQTESYCRRRPAVPRLCCDCQKKIHRNSKRCKSCALRMRPKKIVWPPKPELQSAVEKTSYLAMARKLGVSDNAIRKYLTS